MRTWKMRVVLGIAIIAVLVTSWLAYSYRGESLELQKTVESLKTRNKDIIDEQGRTVGMLERTIDLLNKNCGALEQTLKQAKESSRCRPVIERIEAEAKKKADAKQ